MLGAAVFYLRAMGAGVLPEFTGRVMHGVFFKELSKLSSSLATYVHQEMNIKPFAVSELVAISNTKIKMHQLCVEKNDVFKWRVVGLNQFVLQEVLKMTAGMKLQVNKISMVVDRIVIDGEVESRSGVIDKHELIGVCLEQEDFSELIISFLSPTTFRVDNMDYPLPLPRLVFSSLAEKWEHAAMPVPIDKEFVRTVAEHVYPKSWNGQSQQIFLAQKRGVRGFQGEFTYDLNALSISDRQMLLLLAKFGCFAGCGRMTGQGMGQIEVWIK